MYNNFEILRQNKKNTDELIFYKMLEKKLKKKKIKSKIIEEKEIIPYF